MNGCARMGYCRYNKAIIAFELLCRLDINTQTSSKAWVSTKYQLPRKCEFGGKKILRGRDIGFGTRK